MSDAVRDYRIDIPQEALDDLSARLENARLPEKEPVDDWSQGIPRDYVRELVDYWRDGYDWRRFEKAMARYPQHVTVIDGVDIHLLHVRSPEENARPLVLTHGWPGSIAEFARVIDPLVDPVAHGGRAEDAFHLVVPSLPGYGFSGKPAETGWNVERIGRAWETLMRRLGYDRYYAQGGDWGSMVTCAIATQAGEAGPQAHGCAGVHVNLVVVGPPSDDILKNPTEEEQAAFARFGSYTQEGAGYAEIQKTKPQTLGYALADSPVGQMAWIVEKFHGWRADEAKLPHEAFDRDHLLDNVMIYWLNNAGASSARLYRESFASVSMAPITIPSGATVFPGELAIPSRRWAEQRFQNLKYWNRAAEGGHFAAMEVPEIFVEEVRAAFAAMPIDA